MMELLNFEGKYDIREQIGTKYWDFGTTLLDCSAATISALEKQYQHHALSINHEIFSRWLQGEGNKPVSWATLIELLRDIGKSTLADEIGRGTTPPGSYISDLYNYINYTMLTSSKPCAVHKQAP